MKCKYEEWNGNFSEETFRISSPDVKLRHEIRGMVFSVICFLQINFFGWFNWTPFIIILDERVCTIEMLPDTRKLHRVATLIMYTGKLLI